MTGRPRGRDYMNNPDPDNSRERSLLPPSRYRYGGPRSPAGFGKPRAYTQQSGRPHPSEGTPNYDEKEEGGFGKPRAYTQQSGRPHPSEGIPNYDEKEAGGFGKPRAYTQQSGRPHPSEGTPNYDEEEEGEEDDYNGAGASNDNPLYEPEDEGYRLPSTVQGSPPNPGQGSPSNNPLYGNDPFQPATSQTICMTDFLRPKGQRSHRSPMNVRTAREIYGDQTNILAGRRSPPYQGKRSRSPPVPLPRQTGGQVRGGLNIVAPPAEFSAVTPGSQGQVVPGPIGSAGKRMKQQSRGAITSAPQSPTAQRQFSVQSIKDLIAAVRSDQTLHLGESRRDGNREPRIAGDSDRYFAPRKGDIIVHFNPTPRDNKLLEYFDERRTMQRMQPGDKLVRVKYDNYKIPDHLMITSKLYIYCNGWIYLGKAIQTIKTA